MSHLSVILPQSCDRGLLRSKRSQSQHDFQVDGLTAAPMGCYRTPGRAAAISAMGPATDFRSAQAGWMRSARAVVYARK